MDVTVMSGVTETCTVYVGHVRCTAQVFVKIDSFMQQYWLGDRVIYIVIESENCL